MNCSLDTLHQHWIGRKCIWNIPSERVRIPYVFVRIPMRTVRCLESRTLELVRKMGGNFRLKLNIDSRPIANKYREGKMKRTLERELKVSEIAKREENETS